MPSDLTTELANGLDLPSLTRDIEWLVVNGKELQRKHNVTPPDPLCCVRLTAEAGQDTIREGKTFGVSMRYLEAVLSALRELAALREQVAWRLIASAPKDGTPVLLWDGHAMVATGFDPNYQEWATDDGYEIKPTHWQPLPEPPRDQ